ncbi:cell division protein FtsX [Vagococcus penaei]|uniref:Cell division protein FtsX n=1 Tax=Vagococcus penaei TaxID=633807 RepID=A0A1Q2D4T9_9ENTE|nr:permease-like cell division protein FtsX [Vagococcus penaei]AQP53295.1 cell division protein FtsX [Vagococcus penaei]RSU04064.1 cell division protein FtsX [Vagococcus penaei]
MIRNFFRHIGSALKNLKRNGWMTIASVSAVTVTLTLLGIFLGVIMNISKIADDIKDNVDVSVFVEIGTNEEDTKKLGEELSQISDVDKVTFSSKHNEYKKLTDRLGDTFKLFDGDDNPLYDVYVLTPKNTESIQKIQKAAAELPNVDKADYGGKNSEKIFNLSKNVKLWGGIAAGFLLIVAIFLISNTIRMTIISRKREIQIMRLVGARNGYIRWPFFLEGAFIGVLGSIVPILLISFGYSQVYIMFVKNMVTYQLISPTQLVLQVNAIILVVGVVIGSVGSVFSMRRFLRI